MKYVNVSLPYIILWVIFIASALVWNEASAVVLGSSQYIGDVVITSDEQETQIMNMIDVNNIEGPLGVWSHPYYIYYADNGERILHYAFFSGNDSLPLTKR